MLATLECNTMTPGTIIGSYRIEEVIRPHHNGSSLFRVRYEGSYVSGYLCVAEISLYRWNGTFEALLEIIKAACVTYARSSIGKKGIRTRVLLPAHVSFRETPSGVAQLLGYFTEERWRAYSTAGPGVVTMTTLKGAAEYLSLLHKKGLGFGFLSPRDMRVQGFDLLLPCPVFPVTNTESDSEWFCGTGENAIAHDRRVFALMVADTLTSNTDQRGFLKRLEKLDVYAQGFPEIAGFLGDPSVSCVRLLESVQEAKERRISENRRCEQRNRLFRYCVGVVMLVVVVLTIVHWVAMSVLADARKAHANKRWKECEQSGLRVLSFYPWCADAKVLVSNARTSQKTANEAVIRSETAKLIRCWQDCAEKADIALSLAPHDSHALALKAEAEQCLAIVAAALKSARDARDLEEWQHCAINASKVLEVDPYHQEEIFEYFRKAESDSINEALLELGEDEFTEEEIRLMRIKFMSELGN